MAYPKYSILITVDPSDSTTVVTQYTSKVTAKAALATALGSGLDAYLYLEPLPTRSVVAEKVGGLYTDAYGVVREFATGIPD
jgi:hypothetical protein